MRPAIVHATVRWTASAGFGDGRLVTGDGSASHSQWSATAHGGLGVAWSPGGRWGGSLILGYEELGDRATRDTGFQLFSGTSAYEIFANTRTRLQSLTLRPAASVDAWPHVRVSVGPEFRVLVRATARIGSELRPVGAPQARAATPAAQIFEDLSHPFDVTDQFERASVAGVGGVALHGTWRAHEPYVEAQWIEGLSDVRSDSGASARPRGIRLDAGLTW